MLGEEACFAENSQIQPVALVYSDLRIEDGAAAGRPIGGLFFRN